MTIYNFNLGIGWASSGVEYAQAYRANIFRKNGQKAKFIFMDMFHENIEPMTKNMGFKDDEIIWFYQYFTNITIGPNIFSIEKLKKSFSGTISRVENKQFEIIYYFEKPHMRITAYLDKYNPKMVYKTETVVNGNLIQKDYYTSTKLFTEYFKPVNNQANLYQRRFFNEDGSIAYEELLNGKESLFVFPDKTIYSKENLLLYFMQLLELSENDIIILDRSTHIGPEILKGKGKAKIGVVIHAEHFNESLTNKEKILWNNYYEYQFKNETSIDFFVVATNTQKNIIENQFLKYKNRKINVYEIPVGSLDELKKQEKRRENSLITASRLAGEKHLDWLVQAVVNAKKYIPNLTLDIYGRGGEEKKLKDLITELGAQEYIVLKGQQQLKEVYKNYTSYVSASTSEGFGLTLLEAVGSGLGMVGFDVRYGNQTFIKEGKNGYLADFIKNDREQNILNLTRAIVQLQRKEKRNLETVQHYSYKIASKYLTKNIQQKWLELEGDLHHDKSI